MGIFNDSGVKFEEIKDEAGEYDGSVEEIFRFDVLISVEQDIEIGVTIKELSVEGRPGFGAEYGRLAHTFAELIIEHVGTNTESFMEGVSELEALDVELTPEEQRVLEEEGTGENGSVLLYSFPVLIMGSDEGEEQEDLAYYGDKQIGAGFERSSKAEVMSKVYGEAYREAEKLYEEKTTDAILDHGLLFTKAVETIRAD